MKHLRGRRRAFQTCTAPSLGVERSENAQAVFPAPQEASAETLQMRLELSHDVSS